MLRRWVAEPDVRQALVESARDPDPQVRSRSLRALEPFLAAGEPLLSVFEAGLKDSLRTVRIDAAWGFAPDAPKFILATYRPNKVLGAVLSPLYIVFQTFFYTDMRVRREGLDLELALT